ncbi:NAD-dependent epimerase/dehydratase family protein [Nitrosopumilus piranensis]|uniref:Putative sugar dehydratase/epimerase YfnG n=1 Tax=Nitrosopumilus piranensis TaxID=1582439 RepID=A0A0C5BWC8_9ARCH|nr:NAD(P)-dependent oxidoreductase [Nitrosopumilus piranensis]AJM91285.1 putative sugar dehydratase/epimerase YfnG [Nitrosopumilus piranensis]
MKIFVTGMTGFLGDQLGSKLLQKGHTLGTLVRNVSSSDRALAPNTESMIRGDKKKGISYFYGDLTDYLTIQDALSSFKPDVIIHLGAQTSVAYSFTHVTEVLNVNFMGVVNMAEAARRTLPKLKHFIFSGSAEEYGVQTKFPIPENVELQAASPYAVAKIASEKFLKYLYDAYGFPAIIFRNANSYGRKHNHQFVIESIIHQMYNNKSLIKLGDPRPSRDFVFEPDLLAAYILAAESKNNKLHGESINISTGRAVTIKELALKLARITGYKGKIQWNSFPKRAMEIPKLQMSNSKAIKLLKWKPSVTLDQGLKITASYYKPT